jgi:hypothetical protein
LYSYLFALQFNRFALNELEPFSSEPAASVLRDQLGIAGLAGRRLDARGGVDGVVGDRGLDPPVARSRG